MQKAVRPMPEVRLQPLTMANVFTVLRLEVAPEQREFVATNAESIAEAYLDRSMTPLAIVAGDEPVGFAMYGQDPETGKWWVIRFMIDQRYQRRGYGRAALRALLDLMRDQHGCRTIVLGVEPGNVGAIQLYESMGFTMTGEVDEGELVMQVELAG